LLAKYYLLSSILCSSLAILIKSFFRSIFVLSEREEIFMPTAVIFAAEVGFFVEATPVGYYVVFF